MAITNKALLVSLRIGEWGARTYDKTASHTVEVAHGNAPKTGKYTKQLLSGSDELREVRRIASGLRDWFAGQTLPWCTDGTRIISSMAYVDFMKEYRVRKGEFDGAVARLLVAYPDLREQDRAKHGTLFCETDYPTVDKLADAFSCELRRFPVPAEADFRVDLSESEKEEFRKQMQEVETNAMRECWRRLYDVCSTATETLHKPGKIFRDTLIENISETCKLLSKLNVTDDPQLERMRQHIETILAHITPELCRESEGIRSQAAKALDEAMGKMGSFMSEAA